MFGCYSVVPSTDELSNARLSQLNGKTLQEQKK